MHGREDRPRYLRVHTPCSWIRFDVESIPYRPGPCNINHTNLGTPQKICFHCMCIYACIAYVIGSCTIMMWITILMPKLNASVVLNLSNPATFNTAPHVMTPQSQNYCRYYFMSATLLLLWICGFWWSLGGLNLEVEKHCFIPSPAGPNSNVTGAGLTGTQEAEQGHCWDNGGRFN